MNLNFEWDEDKANDNLKKHKISFEGIFHFAPKVVNSLKKHRINLV